MDWGSSMKKEKWPASDPDGGKIAEVELQQ